MLDTVALGPGQSCKPMQVMLYGRVCIDFFVKQAVASLFMVRPGRAHGGLAALRSRAGPASASRQ